MAEKNPTWGYTRIRGGLKGLGQDIGRTTIKAILKDQGIEPGAERGAKIPWKTFLVAHEDGLAAADFFTVEVLAMRGLVRYAVFFVMKLQTRLPASQHVMSRMSFRTQCFERRYPRRAQRRKQ